MDPVNVVVVGSGRVGSGPGVDLAPATADVGDRAQPLVGH